MYCVQPRLSSGPSKAAANPLFGVSNAYFLTQASLKEDTASKAKSKPGPASKTKTNSSQAESNDIKGFMSDLPSLLSQVRMKGRCFNNFNHIYKLLSSELVASDVGRHEPARAWRLHLGGVSSDDVSGHASRRFLAAAAAATVSGRNRRKCLRKDVFDSLAVGHSVHDEGLDAGAAHVPAGVASAAATSLTLAAAVLRPGEEVQAVHGGLLAAGDDGSVYNTCYTV